MEALTPLLDAFLSFILLYGYVALFVITFLAALVVPVPSSTGLLAASAFASQGYFNFYYVVLCALAGNIAGDLVGYTLARFYGEGVIRKIGLGKILKSKPYHEFKDYLNYFPQTVIYFSRFITEVGPAVNILSGLARIPFRVYLVFEVLGETSYVLLFAIAGYFLGQEWQNNITFLTKDVFLIVSLGITVNAVQVFVYRRKKKHMKSLAPNTSQEPEI